MSLRGITRLYDKTVQQIRNLTFDPLVYRFSNNIHLLKRANNYIFFPRLKLLMLSSKMSHTAILHLHDSDILLPSSVAVGKFDDTYDVDATVDRG
jgi:hypothetical protein